MAVTRPQLEAILARRCGKKLAYAGLDGTTVDGTNADLNDPIREGLASLGLGVADISAVAAEDLAGVDALDLPQLLDVAELRCLESVLGNRAQPDQRAQYSELLHGRFYVDLERTTARKRLQVERQYGIGVATVTSGVLDLGFAQTIDPATGVPD